MSTRFDFNVFLVYFSKNRPAIISIIKIIRSNNKQKKIAFNAYVLTA